MPVEQKMPESLIKTGIYKHYEKGDLYFVEKTFPFKQSGREDIPSVYYYSLYKLCFGHGRSISEFNECILVPNVEQTDSFLADCEGKTVKRFELIKELQANTLHKLLAGTLVIKIDTIGVNKTEHRYLIEGCTLVGNDVIVNLSSLWSDVCQVKLDDFLNNFYPVQYTA